MKNEKYDIPDKNEEILIFSKMAARAKKSFEKSQFCI